MTTKKTGVRIIREKEFRRVWSSGVGINERLDLIADMCRINALSAVKRAGSGHLGSSFSCMDIVVRLYYREMNTAVKGVDHPDRDIYFSSKGHDVPALYAVLFSLGVISEEKLMKLRRFGGLEGHPDIGAPGVEANSGSLGMGISKGRGMAWAKLRLGRGGHVYVITGDGEWQEGQNFEALQTAVQQKITGLTVIMDHNKVQTDKYVRDIVDLGDLETKIGVFGWRVVRCNGNRQEDLERAFAAVRAVRDRPTFIIADTIKGCGVSFMEHPAAIALHGGCYPWHSGAPNDEDFVRAHEEIVSRVNDSLVRSGLEPVTPVEAPPPPPHNPVYTLDGEPVSLAMPPETVSKAASEFVAKAYGEALLEIMGRRSDVVVLDADLAADCRIRAVENAFPDRFIECGIAEQDMVSMAGGLARQGLLPVVNSFASFLAARANEQIYNNAGEKSKVIYACHYAGLIPAGPGKSHQSIRDISLFGALPNCVILQPCNPRETRMVVNYAVDKAEENVMIRLVIGPSPRAIQLPENYVLTFGQGVTLRQGNDAILFAYGPVMLHEALLASEILATRKIGVTVVNMPWLNRLDIPWLSRILRPFDRVFVLEDHAPVGGLGDYLLNAMNESGLHDGRVFAKFAIEGYPVFGTPPEALSYHKLDGISLASRIKRKLA